MVKISLGNGMYIAKGFYRGQPNSWSLHAYYDYGQSETKTLDEWKQIAKVILEIDEQLCDGGGRHLY